MKTKLTPSQSQRLIELGVDASMASENTEYGAWADSEHGKPIFTLSDILTLTPEEIEIGGIMTLRIKWAYSAWFASYSDEDGSTTGGFYGIELIDALFELLVWCINNKFVKL